MKSLLAKNKIAFMSGLLSTDAFDSFLLQEAVIKMAATYTIDGQVNSDFVSAGSLTEEDGYSDRFIAWSVIRPHVRDIIKGKTAPTFFRFTLQLKPEYAAKLTEGYSFLLNIRLDASGIHIISGVSMESFTREKSADALWDKTMEKFLLSKGIDFDMEHT